MSIKNYFYNFDFNNDIVLPENNKIIISKIHDILDSLPALNIVKNKDLLNKTKEVVKNFSKDKKNFLIFGTGGSNLGGKALINILQGNLNIDINFFDNIDPINFENYINKINLNESGFIVISKSGSTPETLSQFGSLIEIFDQKNSLEKLYKNSLIITENQLSPLSKIAHQNNCIILDHEKNIGGRYSVFSNVGMVPAMIAGLNVDQIQMGAKEAMAEIYDNEYLKIAQLFRFQDVNKKLRNNVLMTYSDAMFNFGKWYLQLWAESLGKDSKGITAIHSVGTTDQHSQLQLYLDGPKDKFFTFITSNHSGLGLKLHNKTMKENNLNYLANKTMGDLMQGEQQATLDTFRQNKLSFRQINLDQINEFSMGKIMAFSIMETVATCIYFEVNPFNQPAVELGKKLTIKYLS